MPSGRIDQSLYVGPYKSIEQINTSTLYKPGELGSQVQVGTKAYQLVQVDSGATAATAVGVPLTGQLAFWKDKSKYLVSNDKAQALSAAGVAAARQPNFFAGVFVASTFGGAAGSAGPTAGNYCVIQQRGAHVGVSTAGNTVAAGQELVPQSTANPVAIAGTDGTAPGYPPVGTATAANGAVTANYTPAFIGGWDIVDVP